MNAVKREISARIRALAGKYPVIAVTGPRQSGKSTLVRSLFPKKPYITLENPDDRQAALDDPRTFLANYPHGAVIDEAQQAPELFSYIQGIVDDKQIPGMFVLSGSQNFLLMQNISQSLAGRVAICNLLPFSISELKQAEYDIDTPDDFMFHGGYPRIHASGIDPIDFYPYYIQTYLERDVRLLKNISDQAAFYNFIRLCAGRVGQELNMNSLATDAGISVNTVKSWLEILQTSFVIFLLQPYYKNLSKRVMKTPKLYFYDTGLVCNLLGIHEKKQLEKHYLRGSVFENMMVCETMKTFYNQCRPAPLYFWKDSSGKEVDMVIELDAETIIIAEIKSGATRNRDFFKNTGYLGKLMELKSPNIAVLYGGDETLHTGLGKFVSWNSVRSWVHALQKGK